jgi:phosphoribosylamine--glycine ligase
MNIAVFGNGGREDVTTEKFLQHGHTVYGTDINGGMVMRGCINIPYSPIPDNYIPIRSILQDKKVGLIFVGPDQLLADGVGDFFQKSGIPIFAPVQDAAQIESDRFFSNQIMIDGKISTPPARPFTNKQMSEAMTYAEEKEGQVVIKARGLALGKGVVVCHTVEKALKNLNYFMGKKIHGKAGEDVLIQDRIQGPEFSSMWLCDETGVQALPIVQDYKAHQNGGEGLNTGGMGAKGPLEISESELQEIRDKIVLPCLEMMRRKHIIFKGCLFVGLMRTKDGLMVLEFNARFGDPETQVQLSLLDDSIDWAEVLLACTQNRLKNIQLKWKQENAVCHVATASGYPGTPRKGDIITIPDDTSTTRIFHAGTTWKNGKLLTNGGRVLSIVSTSTKSLSETAKLNLNWLNKGEVRFDGIHYRTDIGMEN